MYKYILGGIALLSVGCASDGVEEEPGPGTIVLGTEAGHPVPGNAGTEQGTNAEESGTTLDGFAQRPDFDDDRGEYAGTACATFTPEQINALKSLSEACYECQCETPLTQRAAGSCIEECTP